MPHTSAPQTHIVWTRPHKHREQDQHLLAADAQSVLFLPMSELAPSPEGIARFWRDLGRRRAGTAHTPARDLADATELIFISSPACAQFLFAGVPEPDAHAAPLPPIVSFSNKTTRALSAQKVMAWSPHSPEPRWRLPFTAHAAAPFFAQLLPHTPNLHTLWYPRVAHIPAPLRMPAHIALKEYPTYHHLAPRSRAHLPPAPLHTLLALPHTALITTFASPAAFHTYATLQLPLGYAQLAIGATTAQALTRRGLRPIICPHTSSASLAQAARELLHAQEEGRGK